MSALVILVLLLVETTVGAHCSDEHYLLKKVRRTLLIPRERPPQTTLPIRRERPPRVFCRELTWCSFLKENKKCRTIKRCKD